ncbi:16387_t:CDS:2 [Funneliformis mosseae]|uniref:16387_t:CDS:1 n=1 Tax=Funneliformis mosseae TaxID=27381 RepID=A0A9N9BDG9_FUNMO|nr:16387_t:CDS:2 [Funneliformis mosseae]
MVSNIIKAVEENIKDSGIKLIVNTSDITSDDAEILEERVNITKFVIVHSPVCEINDVILEVWLSIDNPVSIGSQDADSLSPSSSSKNNHILHNSSQKNSSLPVIQKFNIIVADREGWDLAQLFSDAEDAESKMIKAKQKEYIHWYAYRKSYENKVAEIYSKTDVVEKTAKFQVYTMIKVSLPKVSDLNLYKKTQRAGRVYKLFEKIIDFTINKEVKGIGIDKAYGILYGVKNDSNERHDIFNLDSLAFCPICKRDYKEEVYGMI